MTLARLEAVYHNNTFLYSSLDVMVWVGGLRDSKKLVLMVRLGEDQIYVMPYLEAGNRLGTVGVCPGACPV